MKRKLFMTATFLSLALMVTSIASGQNATTRDRVEADWIAFITKYVNLTPKEAEAFWPIYNEYQDKLAANRRSRPEGKDIDDAEAEEQINEHLAQEQEQLDLKRAYVVKIRTVLSAKKTYLLFEAERRYKVRMLRMLNERRKR